MREPWHDAPVLVTGASGWVAGALCEALLDSGRQVRACARAPVQVAGGRLRAVGVGDLAQAPDWRAAVAGCGTVVHLAARVHAPAAPTPAEWALHARVNCAATLDLARQAAQAGVRRFVFVSSLKVHGDSTTPGHPARPDDAVAPDDPYGQSKWQAECGLRRLAQESGMQVVVVRPPLVYGPGVRANMASMVRWIDRGLPLPFGAVDQNRRSLVSLANLVDFLALCTWHAAAPGQTFLVSDDEDVSTAQLLRRTAAALGRPARLLPVPPRWLDAGARLAGRQALAVRLLGSLQADIASSRSVLGWRPPHSMEQGLHAMAAAWIAGRHR